MIIPKRLVESRTIGRVASRVLTPFSGEGDEFNGTICAARERECLHGEGKNASWRLPRAKNASPLELSSALRNHITIFFLLSLPPQPQIEKLCASYLPRDSKRKAKRSIISSTAYKARYWRRDYARDSSSSAGLPLVFVILVLVLDISPRLRC